jgi:nifR3 family TIM-barrel protein
MLRIGDLTLTSRLLLAPVAGHCDLAFRLTARGCGGVGLAFTDLLCPHGVLRQNARTQWLMATEPADQPLGMQLYGNDPSLMVEAARWAVDHGAQVIDINMGCPADKVTKTFAGAMMLRRPRRTIDLAERLVRTVGGQVPVTAKLRLGYGSDECTAPQLAGALVEVGVRGITIHGRTAAQRFTGSVDLAGIRSVVDAVHQVGRGAVPCIGNGDVRTPLDVQRMIEATGCDGVMIGRAALAAPWILRDAADLLDTGNLPRPLTLRRRLAVVCEHFGHMRRLRGDRLALHVMRQKIAWYGRHLGHCKPLKQAIRQLTDADRFDTLVSRFIDEQGDAADRPPVDWYERDRQLRLNNASLAV